MPGTYKKNYLTDVVFKIEFPAITNLDDQNPPDDFAEKTAATFPKKEQVKQLLVMMENKGLDFNTSNEQQTIWRYKSEDDKTIIELSADFLAIVSKSYKNYGEFKNVTQQVLESFFRAYPITKINRLGLRYINQISLDEQDLFGWSKHLSNDLVKNLDFITNKTSIRRAIQIMEVEPEQEIGLRFQYGIFNSWYPNELLKKEFILDYDCYSKSSFDKENLMPKLDKFNEITTGYFDKSVTQQFKDKLNE